MKSLLLSFVVTVVLLAACLGKNPASQPERVYQEKPATWFEDAWSRARLSADGKSALFGGSRQIKLIDLETGREDKRLGAYGLEQVQGAAFLDGNRLARHGQRGKERGWFLPAGNDLQLSSLPPGAVPQWLATGTDVAWYDGGEPKKGLNTGKPGSPKNHPVPGSITGFTWSGDGHLIYVLSWQPDGRSSLYRLMPASGRKELIADDFDAAPWFNSLGLSPDEKKIYLALASAGPPKSEERHQPRAQRHLDLYEVDLATGARRLKVQSRRDKFAPTVVNGYLYWTSNDIREAVMIVPASGGEASLVIENGEMPSWRRPDGKQIAFTYGGWRLADWALNLDAGVVDLSDDRRAKLPMRPLITGYHEDFTPAWSPDGKWLAFHSHRSAKPVAGYDSEGSTDDIFIRPASAAAAEESRLTDFGSETGSADWSPDGRTLLFCSMEKNGKPGISQPWLVTIDSATGKALQTARLPLPEQIQGAEEAAWSPKGDVIAIEEKVAPDRRILWIVSLNGKKATKLIDYSSRTYGGLCWTPTGETLIYGALAGERMQLFAIAASGGTPRQLTNDPDNLLHPSVSPDGKWIACSRIQQTKEVWRLKL